MRSSEINNRIFQYSRVSFLILLSFVSLILFINGHSGIAFLLIFMTLATTINFAAFFTRTFLPELPRDTLTKMLVKTITHKFSIRESILRIENGKINGDLTLPVKRKTILILHIDHSSAVILFDQKTGYNIVKSGIHLLPRTTSIYAVLPTSLQRVIFGPESTDSLSNIRSGEGLADYHVRINSIKKTATVAADGIVVYPKFDCFYKFNIEQNAEAILNLINFNVGQDKISPSVLQMDFIQKVIFNLAMNRWKKISAGKTSDQILDEVLLRLALDEFTKNGLSCHVYVRNILRED